jgi:hypothetical protein
MPATGSRGPATEERHNRLGAASSVADVVIATHGYRPRYDRPSALGGLLLALSGLLVLKVTAGVVSNYASYFPPDFRVDFLRGREAYFFGSYRWAFYAHLVSGPLALVQGLVLVSDAARRRLPACHRALGRLQVLIVVLVVAPSGLAMAFRAAAGPLAGIGLGALAILTAVTALVGGRLAMRRRFADHRRWMWRCFLLLCSAVVLRLTVGLATAVGITSAWVDPLATWLSWLLPLAAFELWEHRAGRSLRNGAQSGLPAC